MTKYKKQDLYVSGVHIERYHRDWDWMLLALWFLIVVPICGLVLLGGLLVSSQWPV